MTKQNIFNFLGLIINMAGAYIMYHYTPKIDSRFFMYSDEEYNNMYTKDLHKNKMVRRGMFLLFIGFIIQFVAVIIS